MPDDNEQNEEFLLFPSGRDGDRAAAYARYAMGDPVSMIASDLATSPGQVYAMMQERPEEYQKAKRTRQDYLDSRKPEIAEVKHLNRRFLRLSKAEKEYCLEALEHRNDESCE